MHRGDRQAHRLRYKSRGTEATDVAPAYDGVHRRVRQVLAPRPLGKRYFFSLQDLKKP